MSSKITEDFSLTIKDDLSDLFLLLAEEIKKVPLPSDDESIVENIVESEPFIAPIEKIDLSVKSDDLSEFFSLFGQQSENKPILEETPAPITPKVEVESIKPILPKIEKNSDANINLSDINIRINNLISDTNKKLQKLIEYSTLAYGGGTGSYWLNDLGDTDHNSLIAATQGDVLSFDTIKNKWVASKASDTIQIPDTEVVFGTGTAVSSSANLTYSNNTLITASLSVNNVISEVNFENFVDFKETYVDIDFPIIIRTTGPGIPTLVEILSTAVGSITAPQWEIGDYNVAEGQELIHGWAEGTRVYWHVHVLTNGTDVNDRYVRFQVGRGYAPIGSQLSSANVLTSVDFKIPANTPDKTHFIISIDDEELPNAKIGTHVWAILKRIATSNAETYPTPTNNPWCSMLQMHVQVDTLGSRRIGLKV